MTGIVTEGETYYYSYYFILSLWACLLLRGWIPDSDTLVLVHVVIP